MEIFCRNGSRFTAAVATTLLVAACASNPPARAPAVATRSSLPPAPPCNAGAAQFAIGQSPSPQLMESARAAAHAGMVRVIRNEQPFGSQQRADRLNLQLDRNYRITSARCG
ncbi:hypothetical protein [Pseudoxanthomonas dokdonensis]|uniref:Peptidase inhibitor I78 family protein n=1 Tax=Pseudoxanthomonas dokdonensis TaxID=344882 RepID=A0A0R0CRG8_9GAMM|nr:hypothetical protein [Pseudoxanthomonas dokdonensis]KRG72011.1 hypothetical protein ABB29_00660 [Pseudoxanthomonas dokdonensis]